jgi:S-adenosylmethionine:tRNA ribosyltransferase-isomerase
LLVSEFNYNLPDALIAQQPAPERDKSRFMVLSRATGQIEHRIFQDLPEILEPGDLLVLNDTRVFPARLLGHRDSGGKVEALVLGRSPDGRPKTLLKTGGKIRPGEVLAFSGDRIRIRTIEKDKTGAWFFKPVSERFWEKMEEFGKVPLPPYIERDYTDNTGNGSDRQRYQTVYAKECGSAAAPTAGFHFTLGTLKELSQRGVAICFITLHIGYETFRPVKENSIEEHVMHSEFFSVSQKVLHAIEETKKQRHRVVAVGTTTCRVLETVARSGVKGPHSDLEGWTDIFIYPGFRFKAVDALITNFHLPQSTLLMLVAAFAGTKEILTAYREAVRLKYSFYSYGDAMLIT